MKRIKLASEILGIASAAMFADVFEIAFALLWASATLVLYLIWDRDVASLKKELDQKQKEIDSFNEGFDYVPDSAASLLRDLANGELGGFNPSDVDALLAFGLVQTRFDETSITKKGRRFLKIRGSGDK